MSVTAQDVERTGRDTTVAQWGVASVVMVGSAAAGGFAFHYLGEPAWLGVVTAVAVDLALAAWLLIGRRLRAVGVRSVMGTVLELTTMGMTLFLNIGAAVFRGVDPATARVLLGVAHSFLPVVLVLVTMAGGEAQLRLLALRRAAEERERAQREAQLAAGRAQDEAEQQRVALERQRETQRQELARADQIRAGELAAAHHERELSDRCETRDHEARQTVAALASVLALGAALRRRPTPRPKRIRRRSQRPVPGRVPASVPVTDELLSQARRVRSERASEGKSAGRAVLQRELGVPETTARELVRRLGDQPLRVLRGGGR